MGSVSRILPQCQKLKFICGRLRSLFDMTFDINLSEGSRRVAGKQYLDTLGTASFA
jgi:hypothetical protein